MTAEDRPQRPPTLDDVARYANVSRQTISRVINNKGEVSEATRQRVLATIATLGYRPNMLARSLVTRRSLDIGLVISDAPQPPYDAELVRGVEDEADRAGYNVFLCNAAGDPVRELRALERLRGQRIAGAILCAPRLDDEALRATVTSGFPVVLVHRELAGVPGTVVWPGYGVGGRLATEHLLALGRRKIAYAGLPYERLHDRDKLHGYQAAHCQAGVPFDASLVVETSRNLRGGYEALAKLARHRRAVDALFACNDLVAIGALRYAATHGIAVPDDIAIVGFGGLAIAAMMTPTLSTVVVPLYSIGVTAMQELLELIAGQGRQLRHVHAEPRLCVRESSAGGPPGQLATVSDEEGLVFYGS